MSLISLDVLLFKLKGSVRNSTFSLFTAPLNAYFIKFYDHFIERILLSWLNCFNTAFWEMGFKFSLHLVYMNWLMRMAVRMINRTE